MENKLAFFLATDLKMIEYTRSLIKSINDCYDKKLIEIYVVFDQYTNEFNDFRNWGNVNLVNINDYLDSHTINVFKSQNPSKRISHIAYSRLLITMIVDTKSFASVVYLDVDGLLINKIPDKYINTKYNYAFYPDNEDSGKEITRAFIKENISDFKIRNKILKKFKKEEYFQSGLLVINNFKKYSILEFEAITFLKDLRNKKIDDQNLMNYLNKGIFQVINDGKINYRPGLSRWQDKSEIIFLHFAGNNKPLDKEFIDDKFNGYNDIIERYYNVISKT